MEIVEDRVVKIFLDAGRDDRSASTSSSSIIHLESGYSGDRQSGTQLDEEIEDRLETAMELLRHFSGFVPQKRRPDFVKRLEGLG